MVDPSQPPIRRLEDLPRELLQRIYSHVGVASMCRLYVAYCRNRFKLELAGYFVNCETVNVTAEEVITGDLDKIDFYDYAKLPPCHINVITSVGLLNITKWHLGQVKYKSLSVTVDNDHPGEIWCVLNGLGDLGNVICLTIKGNCVVDPEDIPVSVTKLVLSECMVSYPENFEHLTNLTHFRSDCDHDDSLCLPPSVVTLCMYPTDTFDASTLVNLKHVSLWNIDNVPWEKIETVCSDHTLFDADLQWDYPSFKNVTCPHLVEVDYADFEGGGDVTDLFTSPQLARLTSLKGEELTVSNMALCSQLTVLHMKMTGPLTVDFVVPVPLIELKVWSAFPVYGIPQQLEVFGCEPWARDGDCPGCLVHVKSERLRTLTIQGAAEATVDCPNLTDLDLGIIEKLGAVDAPNVMRLTTTDVPIQLANFPRLSELDLSRPAAVAVDVVISQHLKSIRLMRILLGRVSISADNVDLRFCHFDDDGRAPHIVTKVLSLHSTFAKSKSTVVNLVPAFSDISGVSCQELRYCDCREVGQIPLMVEKISVVSLDDRTLTESDQDPDHGFAPIRFEDYANLRALFIDEVCFDGCYNNGFTIPASVRQVSLGTVEWSDDASLQFAAGSQCEHVECISAATMKQLGISEEWCPSYFLPMEDMSSFQPRLLRQHDN